MDEMIEQVAPTNVSLDDLEELINSLSPDEVAELAECDPDDSSMPPYMRCAYRSHLSPMFYRVSSKTVYTVILLFSRVPYHIQKNF